MRAMNNDTPSIIIHATPKYLADQSSPEASEYTFAYTIRITNQSDESVQLLSRHWIITDGHNRVREIQGEGVIGQQPHIAPGETYEYSSGAILGTTCGTMEGSYQMRSASGDLFDAQIAPFALVHPNALQ